MAEHTDWRRRAQSCGLQQNAIAALIDRSEKWVSQELRKKAAVRRDPIRDRPMGDARPARTGRAAARARARQPALSPDAALRGGLPISSA
jgi:hypothetical protein